VITFKDLKAKLPGVRQKVKLAPFTSFKIGGEADFFYEAKTKDDLVYAVRVARKLKIPYSLLGGGTNVLTSDEGVEGLVIKVANGQWRIANSKLMTEAGVPLTKLVEEAAKNNLSGLEPLVGIPGSLGGAIFGNAGIKEGAIGDVILEVEVLDKKGQTGKVKRSDCRFSYRQSRFQASGEVICAATLSLKKEGKGEIAKKMADFLAKRRNQPKLPSAGSIFKNPEKDFAGRLIEACGLKGKRVGGAQIWQKNANWIVNLGTASCRDVLKLILLAKSKVKQKFGILLEQEIRLVGRRV